jgi:hypothetical protein
MATLDDTDISVRLLESQARFLWSITASTWVGACPFFVQ